MNNVLVSIDWDYFMPYIKYWNKSYIENEKNIFIHWYKVYFENMQNGIDIQKSMYAGKETKVFWAKLKGIFRFDPQTKVYVSESHKLSYTLAEENGCREVYSFDAHSDLGYGKRPFLYGINCSNWLGYLLKNDIIKKSNIVYSPYTGERPNYFKELNRIHNVKYLTPCMLKFGTRSNIIHICRSGAWTPPWLDGCFANFIKISGFSYKLIDIKRRIWNPDKLNISQKIDCMLCG